MDGPGRSRSRAHRSGWRVAAVMGCVGRCCRRRGRAHWRIRPARRAVLLPGEPRGRMRLEWKAPLNTAGPLLWRPWPVPSRWPAPRALAPLMTTCPFRCSRCLFGAGLLAELLDERTRRVQDRGHAAYTDLAGFLHSAARPRRAQGVVERGSRRHQSGRIADAMAGDDVAGLGVGLCRRGPPPPPPSLRCCGSGSPGWRCGLAQIVLVCPRSRARQRESRSRRRVCPRRTGAAADSSYRSRHAHVFASLGPEDKGNVGCRYRPLAVRWLTIHPWRFGAL